MLFKSEFCCPQYMGSPTMSRMATQTGSETTRKKRLAEFRLIPRIETYPLVVSFVQTPLGKIALLVVFGLGMRVFIPDLWSELTLMSPLALITFLPEYRRFVLAITPIAIVVVQTASDPLQLSLTLSVIALGIFLYWCAMRWPKSHFGRRPLIFLLSGFAFLVVLACQFTPSPLLGKMLWGLVGVSASYMWFIAYAVTDHTSSPGKDGLLQVATFHPLWGSTNTPYPKGAANLRRIEAQTPEQLAICQLKGVKLIYWAVLLSLFRLIWNQFFHHFLRIPMPDDALALFVRGTPAPWHMCWAGQILAYFELILNFSIPGHQIIAGARMAGFNALRNTYRPLSATTLIEFFNRFYYYFKELLVDFFFYPAFLRYWKKHRRTRTVFATASAVVFGDSFYHLARDWQFFHNRGLWGGIASYQVLIVYNTVLAIGLSVSQLHKRGRRRSGFLLGQFIPSCGVAFFYILVIVFGCESRTFTLAQTVRYFLSLFFIHL